MMLFAVFSIYDTAVSTWLPPIYAKNKGEMLRNFADAVADPNSRLSKHPSDYALFELGTFDDDKCVFDLLNTPVRLCLALDFVNQQGAGGSAPSSGDQVGGTVKFPGR